MNLKHYYQNIREVEASIPEAYPIVVSLASPDGGKEGTRTETPRRVAAKLITEGAARLASADEAQEFREQQAEAKRNADQIAAANRVQFAVLSPAELNRLKGGARPAKD